MAGPELDPVPAALVDRMVDLVRDLLTGSPEKDGPEDLRPAATSV